MLATCEEFAKANNIKFSTDDNPNKSKSKALYVVGHNCQIEKPAPLSLCGKVLPWVEKCDHLGHVMNVTASSEEDCKIKRAKFIEEAVKIREQFKFAHPIEIIHATETYCSNFYGNQLWNLRGDAARMLFASWRTNIKLVWDLPRSTRSYFIENLLALGITPPSVSLMTRQVTFFHSLLQSPSPEIQTLCHIAARDLRSTLGSNLAHIQSETGLNPWEYGGERMRDELLKHNSSKVEDMDVWRISFLDKLLSLRLCDSYNGNQRNQDLSALIDSLSTN